jgi:hypothetical protein
MPTVDEIVALVVDVEARIKDDPSSAREALRQMLLEGALVMAPLPDGSYQVRSVIVPIRLPSTRKPRHGGPSEASSEGVGIAGCAGEQCAPDNAGSGRIYERLGIE